MANDITIKSNSESQLEQEVKHLESRLETYKSIVKTQEEGISALKETVDIYKERCKYGIFKIEKLHAEANLKFVGSMLERLEECKTFTAKEVYYKDIIRLLQNALNTYIINDLY